MNHLEALTAYTTAFVDELTKVGVTEVIISPGSRSTPLAYILAEHPAIHVHINIDERSAAFFALGMAKEKRRPVALLCTSGTAAANYFPAIVEAELSRVPLIVLTADRPHELRDVGAPQAINQLHLYGHHVKWFVEMAIPEGGTDQLRYARTVASRAVSTAQQNPSGVVHLNFPFREPLIPNLDFMHECLEMEQEHKSLITVEKGALHLSSTQWKDIMPIITSSKRGIIVCGPIDITGFSDAVLALSKKTGFPILADPLSQLRCGHDKSDLVIEGYDAFLRDQGICDKLTPDLVIRFGAMPVSKPLTLFLKKITGTVQLVVDGGGGWREPTSSATHMIYADEPYFCLEVVEQIDNPNNQTSWMNGWQMVNTVVKQRLSDIQQTADLHEGKLFSILENFLPMTANLFVGNSMPIRNLDTFFHHTTKNIRIFANRGTNGIDGINSTALGISAASGNPTVLVQGDLSFYHDMNGLMAGKMEGINLLILVINNDGGGIFSFLPQSKEERHFETLFGTPHGLEFSHTAALYNAMYKKVSDWDDFGQLCKEWVTLPGLKVLELTTNRHADVVKQQQLVELVSREIRNLNDYYQ